MADSELLAQIAGEVAGSYMLEGLPAGSRFWWDEQWPKRLWLSSPSGDQLYYTWYELRDPPRQLLSSRHDFEVWLRQHLDTFKGQHLANMEDAKLHTG